MSTAIRIIFAAVFLIGLRWPAGAKDALENIEPHENVPANRLLAGVEDRIIRAKYIAAGFATRIAEEAFPGNRQDQRLVTAMFHASQVLKPATGEEPGKFFVRRMTTGPSFPGTEINPPGMKPRMVRISGEDHHRQYDMAFYDYRHDPPIPCILFFEKGELGWVPFYYFNLREKGCAGAIEKLVALTSREKLRSADIEEAFDPNLPQFAQESFVRLFLKSQVSPVSLAQFYRRRQQDNPALADYFLAAAAAKAVNEAERDRPYAMFSQGLLACLKTTRSISADTRDEIENLVQWSRLDNERRELRDELTRLRVFDVEETRRLRNRTSHPAE